MEDIGNVEIILDQKITTLLAQARSEKWHVGIAYALYYKYYQLIIKTAKSPAERDRALQKLRVIFPK